MSDADFETPTSPGIAAASIKSQERLGVLTDVTIEVRVELGRARMSLQRAMKLAPGSNLELDKRAGDLLDVTVNGRVVARGEAVVVGDRLGVRIVEVLGR